MKRFEMRFIDPSSKGAVTIKGNAAADFARVTRLYPEVDLARIQRALNGVEHALPEPKCHFDRRSEVVYMPLGADQPCAIVERIS